MTYSEALDWLEQVGRGGSRLGLDRVRDYLTRLGAPQDQIPMKAPFPPACLPS